MPLDRSPKTVIQLIGGENVNEDRQIAFFECLHQIVTVAFAKRGVNDQIKIGRGTRFSGSTGIEYPHRPNPFGKARDDLSHRCAFAVSEFDRLKHLHPQLVSALV